MIDFLVKLGVPKGYAGDVWVGILLLAISMAIVLVVKKRNLPSLAISVYVTYAISRFSDFSFLDTENIKAIYFVLVLALVFWVMKRYVGHSFSGSDAASWAFSVILAFSVVMLFISVSFSWIPGRVLDEFFTGFSRSVFFEKGSAFLWTILPMAILFLMKRKSYN